MTTTSEKGGRVSLRRRAKTVNRQRAKRFDTEITRTCEQLLDAMEADSATRERCFGAVKQQVGRMIKRLLDSKLLREQDFYVGDWVMSVKDPNSDACEVIDINYALRTARIKDPVEGEIWVRFQDLVKDEDSLRLV